MAKTVVGLYDNFADAQNVVKDLQDNGFRREDISLVASDQKGEYSRYFEEEKQADEMGSGAGKGAGVGAVLGGAAGLLLGLGVLAIPGIGPVLAAGPIVSALAGAGIGAAAGGIIGALTEAGVPEDEASLYEEGVRHGGTLVTVSSSDDMADLAADVMNRYNPIDVDKRSVEWQGQQTETTGQTQYAMDNDILEQDETALQTERQQKNATKRGRTGKTRDIRDRDDATLPVVEEDLQVGKREVQHGGVRVHTRVTEHPVEEQVNLRRERVNVERRPVDRPASEQDLEAFQDETIEMTETSEEPVVSKRARVVEEVRLHKDVEQEQETVRDTVRRKDVEVENLSGGHRQSDIRDFSAYDNDFRTHFGRTYTAGQYTYEQYQPAYRYGYSLYNNERYRGRNWDEIEPDVRRDWERQNTGSRWEDFKDAIREGWDRVRGQR